MAGFYGVDCRQVCLCQNGGSCDKASGHCLCASGWTGIECELGKKICYSTYQFILCAINIIMIKYLFLFSFCFINRMCSRFLWC